MWNFIGGIVVKLDNISILKDWISESNNIVFFGGAGVSTESSIPDFRSTGGLYNIEYEYPPEVILSHSFFMQRPQDFYRFYRNKMIYSEAKPNITHKWLARMEEQGKVKAVITQNIDGLHQKAGSKKVLELHGSICRNYCMECRTSYALADIIESDGVPKCTCGGIIKPDVVLYEEGLDEMILEEAVYYISHAEVLLICGTSLSVYPAAGLIRYYPGNRMVLINKTATQYDSEADLLIQAGLGDTFSYL